MKTKSLMEYMEILEEAQDSLDLNNWESKFVSDMVTKWLAKSKDTTWITDRQSEHVIKIATRFE